jgi:quercetin dioxygenase-like cupin family protein
MRSTTSTGPPRYAANAAGALATRIGASTGWHWHDGRLYGVIKQGTLTHTMAVCSIDGIYQPGDSVAEPSGADHVHIGRNLGSTPVVMQVLYIDPAGSPLSQDVPDPGCGYA